VGRLHCIDRQILPGSNTGKTTYDLSLLILTIQTHNEVAILHVGGKQIGSGRREEGFSCTCCLPTRYIV